MVRYALLLMLAAACGAQAADGFSFQSYRLGILRMTLVSPSLNGELVLHHGAKVEPIQEVALERLFTLAAAVPCESLATASVIYWDVPGQLPLSATLPAQTCEPEVVVPPPPPPPPPVRRYEERGMCLIDTGGNSLWHVATELAKGNGASVYQHMYALFVTNRGAFEAGDIQRMRERTLHCPEPALFAHIGPEHARRLFEESLQAHRSSTKVEGRKAAASSAPSPGSVIGQNEKKAVARSAPSSRSPVRRYEEEGACLIDTGGNTLWRVATELARDNDANVYQHMQALFVTNKGAFAHGDIQRLRARTLHCPEPALFARIDPDQARRLFEQSLQPHREPAQTGG